MGVVFIEGFDHYSTGHATRKGWSGAWSSMISGPLGGQAAQTGASGGGQYQKTLPGSYAEVFCGFRINSTNLSPNAYNCFYLASSGTILVRVGINPATQKWCFWNAAGNTVIAEAGLIASTSRWDYVEIRAKVAGAAGILEMKVNGGVEIAAFTANIGSANINQVAFGFVNSQNTSIDDIYICDTTGSAPQNTYLGDVRVEACWPTAEGNSSSWTPSAGTDNALMVDDPTTIDDDSTYVSTGTVGHVDTHVLSDLVTSTSGIVFGLKTVVTARKTGAGSRTLSRVLRPTSTDYVGSLAPALSTSYGMYEEYQQQNPAGGDWTVAQVNALQAGYKLIS